MEKTLEILSEVNVAALADRYSKLEKRFRVRAEPPYAVRLDGVNFGRALRDYRAPRDPAVHGALVSAAAALVDRFKAFGAWVGSDEINLLILGPDNPYGGRVEKIVSISSGLASSVVTAALRKYLFFDSRVVPLENRCDAALYILYRARVSANNFLGKLLQVKGVEVRGGFSDRLRASSRYLTSYGEWALLGTSIVWFNYTRRGKPRRRICAVTGPLELAFRLGWQL